MPAEPVTRPDPDEVWGSLVRVAFDGRDGWRRAVVERTGLPFSRIRALTRLARSGPMTLKQLAHAATMDPPATTVTVNDLEERGLVVRDTDPADRRAKLVTLTDAGRAVVALVADTPDPAPAPLREFTPTELGALADMLRRLQE
ncbi:MarR family winged helix-turn-helix transcriptional regulator [Tsukamurella strandjordii]|uniref:MarR family winged helix-turn-helix transcriptional regulator n=1 Tax=Tsukamurella TaxID=2060 RepID=UPI001C7CC122|nr:MarR family transcriptional regulator [Tsukamurella sp. TY48]GIZ96281.1 transcriptional regulator [Tsukamurella sp. TY48]